MAAENARLEGLWGDALRLAADNGEVNMSWQKLGHIDEKVFQFTQTDGGFMGIDHHTPDESCRVSLPPHRPPPYRTAAPTTTALPHRQRASS